MKKKELSETEDIKKRLFRIETIMWIMAGKMGLEVGTAAVSLVSAYMTKGVIG